MSLTTAEKMADFKIKQALPYNFKVAWAERMARGFYWDDRVYGKVCVSVGGLDSITLALFLENIGLNVPRVSVSQLEDKSIQQIHKQLDVIRVKPAEDNQGRRYNQIRVIQEFGFPVISKAKARKIEILQTPDSPKQTFIHAIMTGDMGEQGHYGHSDKLKLPDKWIQLFGGLYNDHRPDLCCKCAKFRVSNRCCYWLKEKPMQDWQREHGVFPYLGLMAIEGGQREQGLMKNGCNYFGKEVIRSCPFAIFSRQDLLQLALDLHAPVPEVYGQIKRKADGTLYTTKAQRTGCQLCGFGIHIEKRPHRFDRLYYANRKMWDYYMHHLVQDDQTGEWYGWGRVLDYIGIEWRHDQVEIFADWEQ